MTELVLEIGGTTMRAARYDSSTTSVSGRISCRTPAPGTGEPEGDHQRRVLRAMASLAKRVLRGRDPERVGVAYAGPLDAAGRVLASPTILRRTDGGPFDLGGACARLWPGSAVVCVNDLSAAGFAYVASGLRDFAVVTVGSGIGHKVFLDGLPRVGAGRGGEIGHLRLDYSEDAPRCDCGAQGHLGALASGRGVAALVLRGARSDPDGFRGSVLARLSPARIDGVAVAGAFRAGDPFTRAVVRTSARYLGTALAALHLDTGVEDVLIVGGFALGMGEDYRRILAAAAADASWAVGQDWDAIVRFGEDADTCTLRGAGLAAAAATSPASQSRTHRLTDAGGQRHPGRPAQLVASRGHVSDEA
ncbi:MAG: hypothetical protein QOK15_2986 [Nocardioidaceae bacterium]|jgi:glucokinase|nr:hypothetical protein [Nocardioidaceae bacterium]